MAVVPAFDPGPGLLRLLDEVAPQVERVVVVDDGSSAGLEVLDAAGRRPGVTVLTRPHAGVAAALNAGVRLALLEHADAVLTLDQDSGVPPGYVAAAVAAWRTAVERGIPLAFVAAETYSGRPTPTRGERSGLAVAFDPMQSGCLVPARTFREVGRYDGGLVIDAVDSELTVRCLAAGLVPVVGPGCHLRHGMGERAATRVLGRELRYNRHSPQRVYYMTRNAALLTRRYARDEPGWVGRRLLEEGKAHTLRLALSPDRARLARAALAGLWDGVRGRTGPDPRDR